MKVFEISRYENGVKKSSFVEAESKSEALEIAWSLGYEDVYVSEVKNESIKFI